MGRATKRVSAVRVYWLHGEERCPHCLQAYAAAVGRHCAYCDSAACPHCIEVVRITGEVICPACALMPEHDPSPEPG